MAVPGPNIDSEVLLCGSIRVNGEHPIVDGGVLVNLALGQQGTGVGLDPSD